MYEEKGAVLFALKCNSESLPTEGFVATYITASTWTWHHNKTQTPVSGGDGRWHIFSSKISFQNSCHWLLFVLWVWHISQKSCIPLYMNATLTDEEPHCHIISVLSTQVVTFSTCMKFCCRLHLSQWFPSVLFPLTFCVVVFAQSHLEENVSSPVHL